MGACLRILVLCAVGGLISKIIAGDRYGNPDEMYVALRDQPHTTLKFGGGEVDVVFADGAPGLDRDRVFRWIRTSAQAVTTYFGRFPVKRVGILIVAMDNARIGGGTTFGFRGSAIHMVVGRSADESVFRDDWILVHEMTHLALPTVPRRSEWLLEGNATYVEPIARAQAGQLDSTEVWRWSIEGMPKGLPQPGDAGLDHTPTWGRTYWGGAAFWLLADIRIRQRTDNRFGLQDALRAINQKSGGNTAHWSAEQVASAGDAATKTDVLAALYSELKDTPVSIDLGSLFAELGVRENESHAVFDDHAPLAAVRRLITAPPGAASEGLPNSSGRAF
jgi:hypothetical protein